MSQRDTVLYLFIKHGLAGGWAQGGVKSSPWSYVWDSMVMDDTCWRRLNCIANETDLLMETGFTKMT